VLAVGVAHSIVPASKEGAKDGADAVRAVGESLTADHRSEFYDADAVVR